LGQQPRLVPWRSSTSASPIPVAAGDQKVVGATLVSLQSFQDAVGQRRLAVAAAGRILAGETIEPQFVIPFKLVTRDNVSSFQ
jgi:ABC-type sugar transport system substrate-binding protein